MRRAIAVVALIAVVVSLAACKGLEPMTFEEWFRYDNPVAGVRASDVESKTKGMTYRQIITRLGATRDVGSGLHVATYVVNDKENLYFSLVDPGEVCAKTGIELLKSAQPIVDESDKIGIRGRVSISLECIGVRRFAAL